MSPESRAKEIQRHCTCHHTSTGNSKASSRISARKLLPCDVSFVYTIVGVGLDAILGSWTDGEVRLPVMLELSKGIEGGPVVVMLPYSTVRPALFVSRAIAVSVGPVPSVMVLLNASGWPLIYIPAVSEGLKGVGRLVWSVGGQNV